MKKYTCITLMLIVGVVIMALPVLAADSDLIISEVMFNTSSANGTDETPYEWIEIHNKGIDAVDVENWQVCDEAGCDTIVASMCPSSNCTIAAGDYWLIGETSADLNTELANYAATSDATATIYLGSGEDIGSNGLSNTGDAVYLITAASTCGTGGNLPCVSDCISWDNTNTCIALVDDTTLAYLSGADGASTSLGSSEQNGQSIVNVSGTWYQSGPLDGQQNQASPYLLNINEAGTTAVIVNKVKVNGPLSLVSIVLLLGSTASLVVLRKRK